MTPDKCRDCGTEFSYGKLSPAETVEVCREYAAGGGTHRALAAKFDVGQPTISRVLNHTKGRCRPCAGVLRQGKPASDELKRHLAAIRPTVAWNKGIPHTAEHKTAISAGLKGHVVSAQARANHRAGAHRGHGTTHNPNKPTVKQLGRWAYEVIKRDHGRCVNCGVPKTTPKSLNAHHVLSRGRWPQLALNVSNGLTLCAPCHTEHHRLNGII